MTPSLISVPILKHTLTNSSISSGKQRTFQWNEENLSISIRSIRIPWCLPPSPEMGQDLKIVNKFVSNKTFQFWVKLGGRVAVLNKMK